MTFTKRAAASLLALAALTGCSIHSQAPIKQVAYDFSDHDFYDAPHATSPSYEPSSYVSSPAPAKSAPAVMVIFEDSCDDQAPAE